MAGDDDEPDAPARHDRRRLLIIGGAGAALIAVAAAVVLLAAGGSPPPPARADATPYDGRSPREPSGRGTRVIVELPRPSLGEAGIVDPERQRTYVQSLEDESAALRSALGARGIRLSDVVVYTRTFDGFAATVDTGDLADLPSLGVRAQPARRFYPATSEPARIPGVKPPTAAAPLGGASVAVLDTGVDKRHPLLANRLDRGYDAVDRDRDPAPAADPRGGRRETSGTALAGILVAAGERVLPIRVAGLQPAAQGTGLEDVAVSDTLLAGLERAVDPNGDGATDDHVPIAVIGVNSPYAGFEDSPEAQAVTGAADLGTLVIAPAGGEGAAAGTSGTIGSPAAAPDALAVGALTAPSAVARIDLELGGVDARGAALLAGPPPPSGLTTAGPVDATDPAELLKGKSLRGKLAVVRAGDDPAGQAVAAAAAGARAVLLADPRDRPLPSIPAGRVAAPVLGVTGAAAEDVLGTDAGAEAEVGDAVAGTPPPATLADAGEGSTAIAAVAVQQPRPGRRRRRPPGRRRARRRPDRDPRRTAARSRAGPPSPPPARRSRPPGSRASARTPRRASSAAPSSPARGPTPGCPPAAPAPARSASRRRPRRSPRARARSAAPTRARACPHASAWCSRTRARARCRSRSPSCPTRARGPRSRATASASRRAAGARPRSTSAPARRGSRAAASSPASAARTRC